jgi:dihydrodipicolinate synthase/N-acetylneuraminate lyase
MWGMFNGLLFFPVTPYQGDGEVDLAELSAHIKRGVDAGAGGVFVACGTGEFSALEPDECAPRGGSPIRPRPPARTGSCCCRRI